MDHVILWESFLNRKVSFNSFYNLNFPFKKKHQVDCTNRSNSTNRKMSTLPTNSISFSILPSVNPLFPFLSLSPILSRFRRRKPSSFTISTGSSRRKPPFEPPDSRMSVSVQMPDGSVRRDVETEPLIDSRNREFAT